MSILCYLKNEVHCIGYSPNGLQMQHPATRLSVGSDARGFHVAMSYDLFLEPFEIRPDLMRDIDWYSAKIEVDLLVYTREGFQTGNYSAGDLLSTIVVSRKIVNHDGVLHREMTVRASTWECLKATIEKIRLGEITPSGREQTVLERTEIALGQVESTNVSLKGVISRLTGELDTTRGVLHDTQALFAKNELVIEHLDSTLGGEEREVPVDQQKRNYRTQANAIRITDELSAIKASRWYRFGQFFSDLINSRRDLRS